MKKSLLFAIGLTVVSTQVFAATATPAVTVEECARILGQADASSSYIINASAVARIRSELKIDADEVYYLLSLYAANKGLQPISNFKVGAVGITPSGDVILGSNIELKGTQLGQGLHAERTVIVLANESGSQIKDLFSSVTPCGGCRQWLNEINGGSKMNIVSKGDNGLYKRFLSSLIPEDFGPHHLGSTGILDGQHVRWSLLNELPVPNSIEPELRDALERSYAPYSNEPSGAVIEMNDGTLYSGAYVENAAYDSYPALTVAVAKMVMSGHTDFAQISHLYVASGSLDPRAAKNIDHRSASKQIAASEALSVAPSKLVLISGLKVEKAQ